MVIKMAAKYFQCCIPFLDAGLQPSNTSKFYASGLTVTMVTPAVHVSFTFCCLTIEGN